MKLEPEYRRVLLLWSAFVAMLVALFWVTSPDRGYRGPIYYEDYTVIQKGMTKQQVWATLVTSKGMIYEGRLAMSFDLHDNFAEPDSAFMPGGRIAVYVDQNDCAETVQVHNPSASEIWNHWMRQLGL